MGPLRTVVELFSQLKLIITVTCCVILMKTDHRIHVSWLSLCCFAANCSCCGLSGAQLAMQLLHLI